MPNQSPGASQSFIRRASEMLYGVPSPDTLKPDAQAKVQQGAAELEAWSQAHGSLIGFPGFGNDLAKNTQADPSVSGSGRPTDLMSLVHEAGFQGNSANIMYAIVLAESGGRAKALNDNAGTGDLSYGLAQINMIGSLGPSRLAEYGLSSNDDLYDPLTNLKVAYALSDHGTNFKPWTTYTSGKYTTYLGQTGANISYTGAGAIGLGGGPNGGYGSSGDNSATRLQLEGVDGLHSLLEQVPELRRILNEALAGGWGIARFTNEIENSPWWKSHSTTARSVLATKANDPATYQQDLNTAIQTINNTARQLGMTDLSTQQIQAIATSALLSGNGANTQWLTQQISRREDYSNLGNLDNLQGQMAGTVSQLQQLAGQYGVKWTPPQYALHAQNVLDGTTTMDTYQQRARDWAKSAFPGWSKQLDEGQTLSQLADPYMQSMSQILEMSPSRLDLYTPMIREALQGSRQKDGDWSPTSLIDFERQLRNDPRYWKTNGAIDTVSSAVLKLGQDWGFGPEG